MEGQTTEQLWLNLSIKWNPQTEHCIKYWFENEATNDQKKEFLGYYNCFTCKELKKLCWDKHLQLTHCGQAARKIEMCYMLIRGKCFGYIDCEITSDSEDEGAHLEYGSYKKALIDVIKHSKYYNQEVENMVTSQLEDLQHKVYTDYARENNINPHTFEDWFEYHKYVVQQFHLHQILYSE